MTASTDDVLRTALLSGDGVYRYELRRIWGSPTWSVGFIMLNPSLADATCDDNTIRRCVAFAKAWGYGAICVRNLFGLISPDPKVLADHADPVGPDNDEQLLKGARDRDALTVCAWGTVGVLHRRDRAVLDMLIEHDVELHHLGLTKHGHPRHPLYLRADTTPVRWEQP